MTNLKRGAWIMGLLLIACLILAACEEADSGVEVTPETQTVVQTVVVTQQGEKETVFETVVETVVVTATPAPTEPAPQPETEKVLRVNVQTYPDIIDPQKSSFAREIAHLQLLYEGLTRLDKDLATVPAAAESWEYNEDATELTFTLREGLKYSDGSVLNAMRFRYAILRNVNPDTAGEYAAITDEILGAPEWRRGEGDEAAQGEEAVQQSVQALDMAGNPCTDYEQTDCRILKLTLSRPAPYFHTVMGLWVAFPAKEELILEGGENWWNSSKYHVGNGPYMLQSLEPFVRGYFVPNPHYWAGVGKVDIEFAYINDTAVAFQAYRNDEFDIITLAAEDLGTVQADEVLSKDARIYPGSCTFDIEFHQLKEPFTDRKVRQAFAMAVDREAWVRDVLKGLGSPTYTFIPKGYPGYLDETPWAYDPEAARQALSESSYGSVENLPKIVDTFPDTPRQRVRHEWLAAKWKEVLDVDIELNPVEPTTYTALTKEIETAPQLYILGWCADFPDPVNWLSVYFRSTGFVQDIGYVNEEFDRLVDAADTETDPEKRMELYNEAHHLLLEDTPIVFMWNDVNNFLVKPWVTGVEMTPQDSVWPGNINPIAIDIDTSMLP
jgi:oligopeptide transport system substrate-binding protein